MEKEWVLVTGGSRGIGRAVVEELAQRRDVVFTWHSGERQSEAVIAGCAELPGWVEAVRCDGTDEVAVQQTAAALIRRFGAPYAVVHNAGITQDKLHIHHQSESWRQVIDTNLNAVFNWNRFLLPDMLARGRGALVLMSSVSAVKGNIGQTAYGASKAAMVGLCKSLALETGRFGIRVNCLLPGFIDSDMTRALPPETLKALCKRIPLRRLGRAQEVAKVVTFLLGEESAYMTGQSLILDGGLC